MYSTSGQPLSVTPNTAVTNATIVAKMNPLRYRGYYYDTETGFYYLQSRYYDPNLGRFINADSYSSTGQGTLGNNMYAYCNNNPINMSDHTGTFGLLTGLAVAGIAISAVVGGVVAGLSTAHSGGSIGEIIASSTIGAVTAGGIAAAAAFGAIGSLAVGAVALISAGIGVVGEAAAISVEHTFHKNDEGYSFSLRKAALRVLYAAGISALSGSLSYGINTIFTGADELAGVAISAEAAALGGIDFGVRELLSIEPSTRSNLLTTSRAPKHSYIYATAY